MIDDIRQRLDDYLAWVKEKTLPREINGWVEITTPLLDRHNDCLQIYARRRNGGYELHDDGYTLADLDMSGCPIDTPRRRALLEQTLAGFGIRTEGERLYVTATEANFPLQKHSLLQAMLAVGDLFYLAKSTVKSLFLEDVAAWFDENDIRYTENVSFTGRSGYPHHFEFVIPKSRHAPERLLRPFNKPSRDQVESFFFSWYDTREVRPAGAQAIAILNDEEKSVPRNVAEALATYEIKPITWSERQEHLELLTA